MPIPGRDKLGRITERTEWFSDTDTRGTINYRYDPHGRLDEVKVGGDVTEQYAYDDNGNRTWSDTAAGEFN